MIKIIFRELRLKGVTKDYVVTFNKGLNIIVGPISTGKTTILKIIDYCLGKKDHPQYKEIYKVSMVLLEISINDEVFTIERKLFSPNLDITIHLTGIKDLNQKHKKLEVSPRQVKNRESISSFILKKLNLWNIPLKESPTKDQTSIDIMSLRDLLWFCYLDQGRIRDDKDFLFEKTFMKNIKFKQVFKVIFDIYLDIEATMKSQYKTYKELLKDKTKSLNSIIEFLNESKIPDKDELLKKKNELEKEIYLAKKDYDNVTKDILEKTKFSESFRQELTEIERDISVNNNKLRENKILKEKMLTLLGQYNEDIRRLNALIDAKKILNPLNIEICPICLNKIIIEENDEKCPICNQKFNFQEIEEDFEKPTTELTRLKSKSKELTDVINNLDTEIINLELEINKSNKKFNQKSIELENRIESFISPLISLREQKYSKVREIDILQKEIDEKIQYYAPLDPLKKEIIEIQIKIEKIKEKLTTLVITDKTYKKIIEQFSFNFYSVLNEFNFPKLDKSTYIEKQLIPIVRDTDYHLIGSAGAIVLITQAWFIAFFHLFKNFESNHPRFFLIDSPQTNIGLGRAMEDDYRDENIVFGIYKQYLKLIEDLILDQIIIVDWIPPKGYSKYYCVEYSGDSEKKPYGLIDDEI